MSLLIIGGTGTLGRQIVRRALDEGHSVRCMVRSQKRAAFLKEWGAELVWGDLCEPDSLPPVLEGITAVIDAATTRATDSSNIQKVDWYGKVSLIQAVEAAGIKRYIFCSILDAQDHREVPLMEIKHCTELFLKDSQLQYTILQLSGFLQGLIGQYAIPILENQTVWVTGEAAPIAYMDTQDIARFAVRSLSLKDTIHRSFPVVGLRAWGGYEIIRLCERLSSKEAKVSRMPIGILRAVRNFAGFFAWGVNLSDRLAFTEVLTSGKSLTADMSQTYQVYGIESGEITTLESYLQDYFSRIMKKLKEIEFQQEKLREKQKNKNKSFWY